MSFFTSAVQEELVKLREEGKVRLLGVSIHDRPRAGPRNVMELRESLAALEKGPLSPEEMLFMREFGRAVHA
jgi:aryl-alcohol dehydrogenase-like predicted oxidoreductase